MMEACHAAPPTFLSNVHHLRDTLHFKADTRGRMTDMSNHLNGALLELFTGCKGGCTWVSATCGVHNTRLSDAVASW